jgi:hypothetical protein
MTDEHLITVDGDLGVVVEWVEHSILEDVELPICGDPDNRLESRDDVHAGGQAFPSAVDNYLDGMMRMSLGFQQLMLRVIQAMFRTLQFGNRLLHFGGSLPNIGLGPHHGIVAAITG